MPEIDVSEALTGSVEESSDGTTTATRSEQLGPIPQECANILLDLLEQAEGNDIHLNFSAEKAREDGKTISDEYVEAYDLPEGVETWSYEDLLIFGDIETENINYYGWRPRNDDNELKQDVSSDEFFGDNSTEVKRRFNGQFAEDISDSFDDSAFEDGADNFVNFRVGSKSTVLPDGTNVERDDFEQRKHVHIYLQDTEETQADEAMLTSRNLYGDLSDEEYADLIEDEDETEDETEDEAEPAEAEE